LLTSPLVLHEISSILNTGLDKQTLSLCVSLCENGVNPEALAVRSLHIEEFIDVNRKLFESYGERHCGITVMDSKVHGDAGGIY
jgi:hypothetical protein